MGLCCLVWYGVVTFYPASGLRAQSSGEFTVTGSYGYAWSVAVSGTNVYYLRFTSSDVAPMATANRANGFGVRCVQYLRSDLCIALKGSFLL